MTRTQGYEDITAEINETLQDIMTSNVRRINAYCTERAGAINTGILKCLIKRAITASEAEDLLERVDRDIWSF